MFEEETQRDMLLMRISAGHTVVRNDAVIAQDRYFLSIEPRNKSEETCLVEKGKEKLLHSLVHPMSNAYYAVEMNSAGSGKRARHN
jgi:hypothetical protein